jgi:hypothetical protein
MPMSDAYYPGYPPPMERVDSPKVRLNIRQNFNILQYALLNVTDVDTKEVIEIEGVKAEFTLVSEAAEWWRYKKVRDMIDSTITAYADTDGKSWEYYMELGYLNMNMGTNIIVKVQFIQDSDGGLSRSLKFLPFKDDTNQYSFIQRASGLFSIV